MNFLILIFSIPIVFVSTGSQAASANHQGPTIKSFAAPTTRVTLCPSGMFPTIICEHAKDIKLTLLVEAVSSEGEQLSYKYSTSGGRIIGKGSKVFWSFNRARVGTQTATVEVKDSHGRSESTSTRVTFEICGTCDPPLGPFPKIQVSCPAMVIEGTPAPISAQLTGPGYRRNVRYTWTVSDGKILKGQGTRTIKVGTRNVSREITATVDVSGLDPSAARIATCVMRIGKM